MVVTTRSSIHLARVRSWCFVLVTIAMMGCAGTPSKPPPEPPKAALPVRATPLVGALPIAVMPTDTGPLSKEDLTVVVRDAVSWTSGVPVVDELSVRNEIQSCQTMPCPDTQQKLYNNAEYILASAVARVGLLYVANVRIQRGTEEVVRMHAQGPDARETLRQAAYAAGVSLRKKIDAAATPPQPPPVLAPDAGP